MKVGARRLELRLDRNSPLPLLVCGSYPAMHVSGKGEPGYRLDNFFVLTSLGGKSEEYDRVGEITGQALHECGLSAGAAGRISPIIDINMAHANQFRQSLTGLMVGGGAMCGRYGRRNDTQKIAKDFRVEPSPVELSMPDADDTIAPATHQSISSRSSASPFRIASCAWSSMTCRNSIVSGLFGSSLKRKMPSPSGSSVAPSTISTPFKI